jgi:hypothetical protein
VPETTKQNVMKRRKIVNVYGSIIVFGGKGQRGDGGGESDCRGKTLKGFWTWAFLLACGPANSSHYSVQLLLATLLMYFTLLAKS